MRCLLFRKRKNNNVIIREITRDDDKRIAEIIRKTLESHNLVIPGTAYFDPELDHLSTYYSQDTDNRKYFIMTEDDGTLVGGVGFSKIEGFKDCVEMQKLYLDDAGRGRGYGRQMVEHLEATALELGFKQMYLETHSNLAVAIAMYENMGFKRIEKPDFVVHGAMDHFYIKQLAE